MSRKLFNTGRLACLMALACAARVALAGGPADALLKLVPADVGATLVIEDLRSQAEALRESPTLKGLARLPAMQALASSPPYRRLGEAKRAIEAGLEADFPRIVDGLLGDAVVLAIHLPRGQKPDDAAGLLLIRARDAELLRKLIDAANRSDRESGKLDKLDVVEVPGGSYTVRRFQPGTKRDEAYAVLDGGILAWSNSEPLIRGVVGRSSVTAGLSAEPKFAEVRGKLPGRALASLFVDPRFVEAVIAASPPKDEDDRDVREAIGGYLGAIRYAGASLAWREGLLLDVHQSVESSKVPEWMRRWAARDGGQAEALFRRVPGGALAMVAGHIDFDAAYDAALELASEPDRANVENLVVAARGVLLDRDVRKSVLPHLGPAALAFVAAPAAGEPGFRLPVVAVLGVEDREVLAAVGNALRTVLALRALDPASRVDGQKVTTRDVRGSRVTELAGSAATFAFALGPDFLALANSAEAVAAFCDDGPGRAQSPPSRLAELRRDFFPDARTFACVDLPGLARVLDDRRMALIGILATDEVDQVVTFARLFRGAFAAHAVDPAMTSIHHTIGLVAGPTKR